MYSTTKSTHVRITPETLRRAKAVAAHYNMPVSALVDEIVSKGVGEREQAINAATAKTLTLVK